MSKDVCDSFTLSRPGAQNAGGRAWLRQVVRRCKVPLVQEWIPVSILHMSFTPLEYHELSGLAMYDLK